MVELFWKSKHLFDMTPQEWESVCDGCGKCCLLQLQDEATEELVFTDVACDLLNTEKCRCVDYSNRSQRVPSCMAMNKTNVQQCAEFAPPSCSYRLLLNGEDLPVWHHLMSGDRDTIHSQGQSVAGRVTNQREIDEDCLEDHVVEWPLD